MEEIGFVILNYKSESRTIYFIKEQVDKLKLSANNSLKIVIVDIESTKESRINFSNHLEISNITNNATKNSKNEAEIFLLCVAKNVGYAKGNNIGVNFLINTFNKINYFVISNNDILFSSNFELTQLISKIRENPKIGAIGPKIIDIKGNDQSPHRYLNPFKLIILPYLLYPLFKFIGKNMMNDVIRNAPEGFYFRIMGSFLIVEKDSWIKINGFDENTFLYCEEKILSEKLEKIGKFSYFLPNQYIIHNQSSTISKYINNKKRIKIEFKSNLYYFRKYKKINHLTILIMVFARNVYLYLYYPVIFILKKIRLANMMNSNSQL